MRFQRLIAPRMEEVEALSGEVRSLLQNRGLGALAFPVELVTREALNNAVLHGSAGRPAARVSLALTLGPRWLVLRVTDDGPGIPAARRRQPRLTDDHATHGRGLRLMRDYADRVRFNRRGNELTARFPVPGNATPPSLWKPTPSNETAVSVKCA